MEKNYSQLKIYKRQAISKSSKENNINSINSMLTEKKAKMFSCFNKKDLKLNQNKSNDNTLNCKSNYNTSKSNYRKILENQNSFVTSQYYCYNRDNPGENNFNSNLVSNFSHTTKNKNPNHSLNKKTNLSKNKSNSNTLNDKSMQDQFSNKEIFYNKNRFNTNSLNNKNQTSHNRLFNELQMACAKTNVTVLETLLNSSCNVQDYKASYLTKNILDLSINNNNNNLNRSRLCSKSKDKYGSSPKQLTYGEAPNENFFFENTLNLNSIEQNNSQGFHINYDPKRDSTIKFAFSSKNGNGDADRNKNNTKANKNHNRFSHSCNSSNLNNYNLNIQKNNYSFYFNLKEKRDNNNNNNNNSISSVNNGVNSNFVNDQKPSFSNINYEINCDANNIPNNNSNVNCNFVNTNKFIKGAAYEKETLNVDQSQLEVHKKHKSISSFLLNPEKKSNYYDGSNKNYNNNIQNDLNEKIKSLFATRNNNINNNINFSFNCSKTEGTSAVNKSSCPNNLVSLKSSINNKNINNPQNNGIKLNKNPAEIIGEKTYKLIEANKKTIFNNNNFSSKRNEINKNQSSYIDNSNKDKMFFINTDKRHSYNDYQEPGYYEKRSKSREISKQKNAKEKQNEENIREIKNVDLFDLNINKGDFVVRDEDIKNNRILNDISTVSHNNLRGMFYENGNKYDSLLVPESIYSGLELQEAKISPIASPRNEPKLDGNNRNNFNNNNNVNINARNTNPDENFNINNQVVSNLLSDDPKLIYGNFNVGNNYNYEKSNAGINNYDHHHLVQKGSLGVDLSKKENKDKQIDFENNTDNNLIDNEDANEQNIDEYCNISDTEEFGNIKNTKVNIIYDSHNWNNLNILMKNPTVKLERNGIADETIKNNIDNIAENTANINSYRKNFVTKKPTIFNVDSILTVQNPIAEKELSKSDNQNNNNNQTITNNNSKFKLIESDKNDDEEKNSASDSAEEEIEEENMVIGSSEVQGLKLRPLENIVAKTKRSCMDYNENPNGDPIGALNSNHDIRPQSFYTAKTFENEKNDSIRNNFYDEMHNPTKDLKENDDMKNYDLKIDELQSQLLELQKDKNELTKNNYTNYESIKINAQAMRDKISGLVLNEIQIGKEFEQFIREKYSSSNLNLLGANNLKKINTHQTNNFSNYFQSVKSINEISVDNFIDVITQKDVKNILSDDNIESIVREKIEFLNHTKHESFADKERKYLEIIEKLFTSIKEIQVDKAINEINNKNMNNADNININFNNERMVKESTCKKNENKKFLHTGSLKEKRPNNFKLSRINEAIKIDDEDIKNSFTQHSEGINQDDSLLEEFLSFKNEDLVDKYKFEIQEKYVLPKRAKIVKEIQSEGKLIRFYDNNVIDVISKNQNMTRLFQDGYSINYYKNKDIKQSFPEGYFYYYYNKSKSIEFNFENKENFVAYLFQNGQLEKHYNDGRKHIKFPDGSFKILRPNGEEVNFSNNSIQRKDKLGRVVAIKNIV